MRYTNINKTNMNRCLLNPKIMITHSLAKFYIKYIFSILNLACNSISYCLVPDGKKLFLNTFGVTHFYVLWEIISKWVKLPSEKNKAQQNFKSNAKDKQIRVF